MGTDSRGEVSGRVMRYDRWEHQWLRAWRWYGRTLTATGRVNGRGSLDAEDFSEALCQSIWHLKDWLKNDQRQTVVSNPDIEFFANNNAVLKVIADLCNGSKHAVLSAGGIRAEGTKFGLLMWSGDGDPDDPESIKRVELRFEAPLDLEEDIEVVDLARLGLGHWRDWLEERGIHVPEPPEAALQETARRVTRRSRSSPHG